MISKIKLFFALSRTPHGLLDMVTPAFAALLWLHAFPPLHVIALGLITAFAGYTAVYALNDLIGCGEDTLKMKQGGLNTGAQTYLDAVMVRHPVAGGYLSYSEGIIWSAGWGIVALAGACLLNPVCAVIFISACILECIYCRMWDISPLRTIISGVVKTSGPVAAVFAVDTRPDPLYLLCLFLVIFFWEIGGQNIPADWTDIDEDTRLRARTIPVVWGPKWSGGFILGFLIIAVILSGLLFFNCRSSMEVPSAVLSVIAGSYLLLAPALRLRKTNERLHAMVLFNRASYYPLALFCSAALTLLG